MSVGINTDFDYNAIVGRNPYDKHVLEVVDLVPLAIDDYRDCGINFIDKYVWILAEYQDIPNWCKRIESHHLTYKSTVDYYFKRFHTFYLRLPENDPKKLQLMNRLSEFQGSTLPPDMALLNFIKDDLIKHNLQGTIETYKPPTFLVPDSEGKLHECTLEYEIEDPSYKGKI